MEEDVVGREQQKYNTLRDFLLGRPNRRASEDLARFLFKRILSHVESLHEHGKIHKNLNLETIFVTANGEIKVGDYIHPDSENISSKSFCHFHAPEMWGEHGQVYPSTDVWSLGIILFVMVCGVYPFLGKDETEIWFSIQRGSLHIPPFVSASCAELIRAILNPVVGLRPSIAAIKAHSWIQLPSSLSHSLFLNDHVPASNMILSPNQNPLYLTNGSIPNPNSSINMGRSISFDAIPSPSRDNRRRSLQDVRNENKMNQQLSPDSNGNDAGEASIKTDEPWLNPEHKGRRAFSGDTLVQSAIQKFIQEKSSGINPSLNNNNFYAPLIGNDPNSVQHSESKIKSEDQSPTNQSSSPASTPEELMSNNSPNNLSSSAPTPTQQLNEQTQILHQSQNVSNIQLINSHTPAELTATLNSTNPELRKLLEQVKFNNPQNLFNPPVGSPVMTSSGSFRLSKKLKNANKRMKMAHNSSSNTPILNQTTPPANVSSPSPSSNSPDKSKAKSKAIAQPKTTLPPQPKPVNSSIPSHPQIQQFNIQQRQQQQFQSQLIQQQQQHQLRYMQQMNENGMGSTGGFNSMQNFDAQQHQNPYLQYQMQNRPNAIPNSNPQIRNAASFTRNSTFSNPIHPNMNQTSPDHYQHIRLQDPLFLSDPSTHSFSPSYDPNSTFADIGDKSYTALLESVEFTDLDNQLMQDPPFPETVQ